MTKFRKRKIHVENADAQKRAHLFVENSDKNKLNVETVDNYLTIFLSLENHLANNLFVYNEHSFPAKIRKLIRKKLCSHPKQLRNLFLNLPLKIKPNGRLKISGSFSTPVGQPI